jgi:hypothetical protein
LAQVKVTDHRTADDFALCMREPVEVDVPTSPPTPLPICTRPTRRGAPGAQAARVPLHNQARKPARHVEIEVGVLNVSIAASQRLQIFRQLAKALSCVGSKYSRMNTTLSSRRRNSEM